jgi:hypothetical protein
MAVPLLGLSFGCSTFNRDWHAAATNPTSANDITGRWQGEWRSNVNGHHGRLRCVVQKQTESEYRAHFKAVYWKVLRFSYAAVLRGQRTNDTFQFHGEADLGKVAGGVYEYEGTATSARFSSTYRSRYDHGVFEMNRPEAK